MTATSTASDRLAGTPSDDGVFFEWKFERVRAPRDALERPRCTDALRESSPRLVLLAAPPGFGKTTLLAQWREVDGRAFACLSLDSGDNDPVTFWTYIVQAIRHAAPEWGAAALSALREPRADVVDAVVPAVLHDLEAIGEELVLVLDDYQEITNRICHDSLSFFLERTPSNVTLVVSTRSDPPIPMGRLRALEELLELRAADLSFTEAESAIFLNEILHLGLATETLGALHERTEGWPVGVHLAAMSLSHEADPEGFVARFGGANRHIVDYLTEVVLDTLDEKRHQFLLETSVLGTMSGPLCDAATGRQGSAEVLVELERANLFLIPLDDRREWYRYHELFADVLRNQLLQSDPELADAVHRRASEWLGPEGYRYEAVRHAVAAQRARERDHVGVGRLAPLARAGRRRGDPPPARGASPDGRRRRCATRGRSGLGAERAQSPRGVAGRARVGGVGPSRTAAAMRPPVRGCDRLDPCVLPMGRRGPDAGRRRTCLRAAERHVLDRKTGLTPRARLGATSHGRVRGGARATRAGCVPRRALEPVARRRHCQGDARADLARG